MREKIQKGTALLCLVMQLMGGVSGTLLPVAALAKAEPFSDRVLFASRTALYVLGSGETTASVAKKFGLTFEQLKKLNEFRSYSKPFEQLTVGDEVDVPHPATGKSVQTLIPASDPDDTLLANKASTVGGMLKSDLSGQASNMARSAVVGSTKSEVESWLSQFGTARVQLNLDDEFSLDGSAIDLLVPLHDNGNQLLFTQWGLRNKEGRNTANIGMGGRTFLEEWMLGVNAFYDDDMTGHNRRIGIGVEAWTDYLKLSANSYSSITSWHQSRDFADYNERPADGFDIRAEGYLPVHPQLGAKLLYEQYRGEEVALFGKNDRQHDPKAVTLGLNYTPIPLLTVGVDRRQGQSGKNDTQVNVEMNYRIGGAWGEQVDPSAVALARTLAGSRYDLVDRNNDIVLEYKKQVLIRLSLPSTLRGEEGNIDHVTATATAKYGIDHIEWNYGALLSAGGKVKELSKQTLEITYPPFKDEGNNLYRISAVAYDTKGNTSNQSLTEIQVSKPDVSTARVSELTSDKDTAIAGGADLVTLSATLVDAGGNPVEGAAVSFATDRGALSAASAVTDSSGVASVTLVSTEAGAAVVTATAAADPTGKSRTVTFIADASTAGVLTLVPDSAEAPANGLSPIAFTATLVDENGNLLGGEDVGFTISGTAGGTPALSSATVTTSADGTASVVVTDSTVETVMLTAKPVSNPASAGVDASVNFTEIKVANLAIEPVGSDGAYVEGGVVNIKVKATDSNGVIAPGVPLNFSGTNVVNRQGVAFTSGKLQLNAIDIGTQSFTTGSDGTATFAVTDPNGLGVKTTVNVFSGSALASTDVRFSIITSPDTDLANMYGHMDETVVGYARPKLKAEASGSGSHVENNETWVGVTHAEAIALCGSEASIPSQDSLLNGLYRSQGNMEIAHGWPTSYIYRSSTPSPSRPGVHLAVSLIDGATGTGFSDTSTTTTVSCF